MSEHSATISAKVSPKFKSLFEKLVKKLGYINPSDAFRDALREFYERHLPDISGGKKNDNDSNSG